MASAAQAGFLRDRQQCEKSQGFGDRVPELFPNQTKTENRGGSALAISTFRRFTLNQYIFVSISLAGQMVSQSLPTSSRRNNETTDFGRRFDQLRLRSHTSRRATEALPRR